jgi:hypothetical protein
MFNWQNVVVLICLLTLAGMIVLLLTDGPLGPLLPPLKNSVGSTPLRS